MLPVWNTLAPKSQADAKKNTAAVPPKPLCSAKPEFWIKPKVKVRTAPKYIKV